MAVTMPPVRIQMMLPMVRMQTSPLALLVGRIVRQEAYVLHSCQLSGRAAELPSFELGGPSPCCPVTFSHAFRSTSPPLRARSLL